MGFSINSKAPVVLSDMMERRWEDFESARTYLKNNTHFSFFNTGVLNAIFGQHQQIVDEIDQFLSKAAEGDAGRLSTAVTDANVMYQRSDLNAAARADAQMPSVPEDPQGPMGPCPPEPPAPCADQTLDRSAFGDRVAGVPNCSRHPTIAATTRTSSRSGACSAPTAALRDVIWKGTALAAQFGLLDRRYDILDEVVRPISGDWRGTPAAPTSTTTSPTCWRRRRCAWTRGATHSAGCGPETRRMPVPSRSRCSPSTSGRPSIRCA